MIRHKTQPFCSENVPVQSEEDVWMQGRKQLTYSPCIKIWTLPLLSIWAQLIISQCFRWQADNVKLISILHLTLIHSAGTRSSRSSAVEELLAASHKKELLFLFFLEAQKRKEVHVHCSLGRAIWWRKEEKRKKNWEIEWKRYSTLSASLENIPMSLIFVYRYLGTRPKLLSYYFAVFFFYQFSSDE